jgi:DNA-binding transcriptional ArsR family regulator
MDQTRCDAPKVEPAALLGHPVRVQILAACDQGEVTPKDFVRQEDMSLESINYHFRELMQAGFLFISKREQAGGAERVFYRARRQGIVTDKEFAEMSFTKRQRLTAGTIMDLSRRAMRATAAGTIDRRPNSHVTWDAEVLDQQGHDAVMVGLMAMFEFFRQVKKESAVRLQESGEEGIYTYCGLLGFESPPEQKPGARPRRKASAQPQG